MTAAMTAGQMVETKAVTMAVSMVGMSAVLMVVTKVVMKAVNLITCYCPSDSSESDHMLLSKRFK